MKKLITIILSVILVLGITIPASAISTAKKPVKEKPAVVTMAWNVNGELPKDIQMVEAAINKLVTPKINVKVKLMPVPVGNWAQVMNVMLTSNEKLDLVGARGEHFSGYVAKGQIIAIDDLLQKDGQGIKKVLGDEYIKAGKINGKTYGVSSIRDFAAGYVLEIRKDYIDKYKIDTSKIKKFEDFESLFKTIKTAEPSMTPLITITAAQTPLDFAIDNDPLSDGFGQLLHMGNNLDIVNWYEHPRYAEMLKTMRNWYVAGYLPKDIATNKEGRVSLLKANKGICFFGKTKPGFDGQESRADGMEMVGIPLVSPLSTTTIVQTIQWTIPRNSKNPSKAMQFLNLMYTDADLVNLLDWGIEGRHYVRTSDGTIDYAPDVTAKTSGWNLNYGWAFGNQFISKIWKGDPLDLWKQLEAFNNSATKSKALGFSFDASSLKTEYASLVSVKSQYKMGLETGTLNPDNILPEFISKLKAAGIDKYIAEKQRQLDIWAKNN